jgi:hypothetical protein
MTDLESAFDDAFITVIQVHHCYWSHEDQRFCAGTPKLGAGDKSVAQSRHIVEMSRIARVLNDHPESWALVFDVGADCIPQVYNFAS